LTEDDLRKTLLATAVRRRGDNMDVEWGWAGLGNLADLSHQELRHILTTLVERIVLDPEYPEIRRPLPAVVYRS
jgi:hypothetical protein